MGKIKRKKRKEVKGTDYFKPLDIATIGSDKDPCFGKHFSLSEDTCRMCGDQARCSIVMGQKQLVSKEKLESENRFKDIESAELDKIKKYILRLRDKKKISRLEAK